MKKFVWFYYIGLFGSIYQALYFFVNGYRYLFYVFCCS